MKASARKPSASFAASGPARRIEMFAERALRDQEDEDRTDGRADQGSRAAEQAPNRKPPVTRQEQAARQRQRDGDDIDRDVGRERTRRSCPVDEIAQNGMPVANQLRTRAAGASPIAKTTADDQHDHRAAAPAAAAKAAGFAAARRQPRDRDARTSEIAVMAAIGDPIAGGDLAVANRDSDRASRPAEPTLSDDPARRGPFTVF